MVRHVVVIEKGHLLLNGTKDAGVAGMQTDDVLPLVIKLLHQFALFLKIHVG